MFTGMPITWVEKSLPWSRLTPRKKYWLALPSPECWVTTMPGMVSSSSAGRKKARPSTCSAPITPWLAALLLPIDWPYWLYCPMTSISGVLAWASAISPQACSTPSQKMGVLNRKQKRKSADQHAAVFDEGDDFAQALQGFEVGHHPGTRFGVGAHACGVLLHHLQIGAHMRGQVGLVDDEQVALGDAGAAFARDFFACGHVDHVDRQVRQLGAEGGGQVVAAAFDEHDVGIREFLQHAVDRFKVDRRVLADGRVRAAAGLHAHDALGGQRTADGQQALVFLGVDVVGDGDQVPLLAHLLAQHLQQGGLARADRPANAHAQGRQFFSAVWDVVGRVHVGIFQGTSTSSARTGSG